MLEYMQLFNTLTQRVETLNQLGDEATLYVCGVTPYDTTHLGHAFVNVVYDTLVRYLRWRGQPVRYVQNVTDIDDDILRKARELGTSWDALGNREIELYLRDLRALNVEPPTANTIDPSATPERRDLDCEDDAKPPDTSHCCPA